MAVVTLHARGDAPPALAWERYADPALWSTWAPQIQRVETDVTRLVAGATGTVHTGLLPWPTLPVPFVVDSVDEATRTWEWTPLLGVRGVGVRLHLEHGVDADTDADGVGSATWLRVHGPLPVVAAYAPLARLALGRLVSS